MKIAAMSSRASSSRVTSAADLVRFAGSAIGVFILVNLVGELVRGPFDTLPTFITVPAPAWLRRGVALITAVLLIAHAASAFPPPRLRRAGALLLGGVAGLALIDAARFYRVLAQGAIHTPAVVPGSIAVAAGFAALAIEMARDRGPRPPWTPRRVLGALGASAAIAFVMPLLLMFTFGPTRYDRRADCAVVLGARVWDDGTPSQALADRVDEAIRLYHRGLVSKILMSGAIDEHNGHSEPEVMRARAEAAGVPREAILLDEEGVDTASTVRNTARLFQKEGIGSALLVSHYYHEPRLKMLFDRAGVPAYTVPAKMHRRLLKEPYFIVREVAAFYHSFLLE